MFKDGFSAIIFLEENKEILNAVLILYYYVHYIVIGYFSKEQIIIEKNENYRIYKYIIIKVL